VDSTCSTDRVGPNVALFTVSIDGTTMTSDSPAFVPSAPLANVTVATPEMDFKVATMLLACDALTSTSIGVMTPAGTPPACSSWYG
jgi:hypothetical protein